MYENFSTELEDESHYEVADELEKFFRHFEDGEMAKAEQEFDMLPPMQSWIYTDRHINDPSDPMQVENKSSNTIEGQNMEEEESDMDENEESNMDADDDTADMSSDKNKDADDGWTLVTSKRNK